jgi:hypothetical protein
MTVVASDVMNVFFICDIKIFILIVWCISLDNLGISFGKCHFCYTYLFAHGPLVYSVLCFVCERPPLFACLKKFSNSSYLFAAVCEGNPFCFLVLRVSVCFIFVVRWFF